MGCTVGVGVGVEVTVGVGDCWRAGVLVGAAAMLAGGVRMAVC